MTPTLRVALIFAIIIYFVLILKLLKDKALLLKYSLLWMFSGFAMLILVAFPQLLTMCANLVGIQSNMNALFIFFIAFILMILMSLTSIATRLNRKIRTIIQETAIMEKRIRDLESKLKEYEES